MLPLVEVLADTKNAALPLDTIRCADLFDLCATLPDKSVDMILCDLPYGTTACSWDTVIPFEPMWAAFRRVIKPRGAIVLTASQPFTSRLVCSALDLFKYCWTWVKTRPTDYLNAKNKPMKSHEDITVFSLGTTANLSPNMMNYYPQRDYSKPAWSRVDRSEGRNGIYAAGNRTPFEIGLFRSNDARYPTSVLSIPNTNHELDHPTQKPVALFEYLIRTYTQPGDVVLDPCVGSGTTAVAARKTDRRYICGDSSPEYVATAVQRLQNTDPFQAKILTNGTKQLSLFEVAS